MLCRGACRFVNTVIYDTHRPPALFAAIKSPLMLVSVHLPSTLGTYFERELSYAPHVPAFYFATEKVEPIDQPRWWRLPPERPLSAPHQSLVGARLLGLGDLPVPGRPHQLLRLGQEDDDCLCGAYNYLVEVEYTGCCRFCCDFAVADVRGAPTQESSVGKRGSE